MGIYIGFYHLDPDFQRANGERARAGDNTMDPAFREKVVGLRDRLPSTLTLIGSYGTQSPTRGAVWICETDNASDLQFVSNYYTGYLVFDWVPAFAVGTTTTTTQQVMDSTAANR